MPAQGQLHSIGQTKEEKKDRARVPVSQLSLPHVSDSVKLIFLSGAVVWILCYFPHRRSALQERAGILASIQKLDVGQTPFLSQRPNDAALCQLAQVAFALGHPQSARADVPLPDPPPWQSVHRAAPS